jgi:hypothetical protein
MRPNLLCLGKAHQLCISSHWKRDYKILILDKSISDVSKRIDRLDSMNGCSSDSNHWKGKEIILLDE